MKATTDSQSSEATLEQAETLCRKRGARFTPMRREVFELMLAEPGPRSAYDLMATLEGRLNRRLAPPTVYRALDFLLAQGFIHRLESTHAYLPCMHIGHAHHGVYLVCERCGQTVELDDPTIATRLEQGAEAHGFSVNRPVVELHGRCGRCREDD